MTPTCATRSSLFRAFHLHDERSGKAYSLVVVEDEASGAQVQAALAQRSAERRVGVDPDSVQFLTARAF